MQSGHHELPRYAQHSRNLLHGIALQVVEHQQKAIFLRKSLQRLPQLEILAEAIRGGDIHIKPQRFSPAPSKHIPTLVHQYARKPQFKLPRLPKRSLLHPAPENGLLNRIQAVRLPPQNRLRNAVKPPLHGAHPPHVFVVVHTNTPRSSYTIYKTFIPPHKLNAYNFFIEYSDFEFQKQRKADTQLNVRMGSGDDLPYRAVSSQVLSAC